MIMILMYQLNTHKSMENNFSPALCYFPIDETSSEFIYLNAKSVNDRPNFCLLL